MDVPRRTVLATAAVVVSLSGCGSAPAPEPTDEGRVSESSPERSTTTDNESPQRSTTASSERQSVTTTGETTDAEVQVPDDCSPVTLPVPDAKLEPLAYPAYPDAVSPEKARSFATAFERAFRRNTFIAERGSEGYDELAVSVRTEWVRQRDDGVVVHVEGEIDAADVRQTPTSQTSAPTLRQPFSTWLYLTDAVGLRHSVEQATPDPTDPTFRTAGVIYCADA